MSDSQKDEKPRKDWWDKADIIAKALVAVVIALVGWWIQNIVTTQNTGKDYIGIALGILERKDLPEDLQKNTGLRRWAVRLLDHYSPERLDDKTAHELISGQTRIPLARDPLTPPTEAEMHASATFSVIEFNKDKSLRVSINGVGVVEIIDTITFASRGAGTDITSPEGVVFAPDNHHFAVYNKVTLNIFDVDMAKNYERQSQVSADPASGVQSVTFTDDNLVLVKGPDGKETKYTLRGLKIAQYRDITYGTKGRVGAGHVHRARDASRVPEYSVVFNCDQPVLQDIEGAVVTSTDIQVTVVILVGRRRDSNCFVDVDNLRLRRACAEYTCGEQVDRM